MATIEDIWEFETHKDETEQRTAEEMRQSNIDLAVKELMHADRVLTRAGNPSSRAINALFSEMSDRELEEIISNLSSEQAKIIEYHMNYACVAGHALRFKKILDASTKVM